MLINEIPDDCLLAIFDYLNKLDDLINCYKVCVKWNNLIVKRTKKVKYLTYPVPGNIDNYSHGFVYYGNNPIDVTYLSKLFTNLIIAELTHTFEAESTIEFVRNQKSLRGLININNKPIEKYCDNLEMLSVLNINPNYSRNFNGSSIKQLHICNYSLEALKKDVHYFPNLERLRIEIDVPDNPYDGPILEKLKMLELNFGHDNISYGFQLMDSCPNLQSAHITMITNSWFIDETLKHKCLQDLVIEFFGSEYGKGNNNLIDLKRLLMKYPNLKHLALRDAWNIPNEDFEQLVHILPNLVLLDVRQYYGVTQRAADYVKDYCKRNGRSIKFYYNGNAHEIESDWPQLSRKCERISRGFDFMKHCFFVNSFKRPYLLIPIDY